MLLNGRSVTMGSIGGRGKVTGRPNLIKKLALTNLGMGKNKVLALMLFDVTHLRVWVTLV